MAVNVKMGVELGGFTTGIKQGQQQLKTLKAEMKATEAEFKATGNSEKALADKTKILTQQLKTQDNIVKQSQAALKAMTDAGIKPTDAAYQKMYVQMLNATAGMNETQAALNGLSGAQQTAASGADKLTDSINGIGKKISLDQVKNGIDSITDGLENAARKAAEVGKAIWDEIMASARWADDTATQAQMYGVELTRLLQIQKLFGAGMDTTVEAILTSQSKMERNIATGSKTVNDAMQELGLTMTQTIDTGFGKTTQNVMMDSTDMFWKAGKAILAMDDAFDQEKYAMAIFGRSWHDLVPLFSQFKDKNEFEEALKNTNVESEDTVNNLAKLSDKVGELETSLQTLEHTVWGALAEPLTQAADALNGLLVSILDYLEKPEGQQALEDLGTAVSGLFEDLGKIDPEDVVKGFTEVFNTVVGGLQWMVENKDTLTGLLTAIVGGWAAAKITGGALTVVQLINGISTLSAGSAAASAGAAAGTSWGAAFAGAVAKAAPWLLFLYTLLNPGSGNAPTVISPEQEAAFEEYTKGMSVEERGNLSAQIWGEKFDKAVEGKTEAEAAAIWQQYFNDYINSHPNGPGSTSHTGQRKRNITGVGTIGNIGPEGYVEEEILDEPLLSLLENQRKAAEEYWDKLRSGANPDEMSVAYQELYDYFEGVHGGMELMDQLLSLMDTLGKDNKDLPEWWFGDGEGLEVEITPDVQTDVAQEQLDNTSLTVDVIPKLGGFQTPFGYNFGIPGHANGLWSVPYDGYLARLHKDEQIVSAREVSSRNYANNLYVESMYMNNGMDAQGLAQAMAAEQRRTMSGYGS